ncbi:MAG: hypothetical protein GIW94_01985 [Candidatus Eremiobacteraeota bacterium]|nr:hypothetical protein [Candidatus Eremiobacteraeota bacterium]MBC5822301.1 hypothetical protein [Candidatus Eremiobacteraeota bacterium]
MNRTNILFVANGHGENAIAARIAGALPDAAAEPLRVELLSLVGVGVWADGLAVVGPRRALPSGGLVAMGNVRAFGRDVVAGFPALLAAQLGFLRRAHRRYAAVVAVGDAYALGLALLTGMKPVFVGTAKSVFVARYGPLERLLLRRAATVYVRDEPTAHDLVAHGVMAEAPGNVIADLARPEPPALPGTWIGLLPGSRESAYADAVRLGRVARALAARRPHIGALLSVAPALDARRLIGALERDGWTIGPNSLAGPNVTPAGPHAAPAESPPMPMFEARAGPARLAGWSGPLGALLAASSIVLGQAGTANEQAAAQGLPVIALEGTGKREDWYRMRQRRLLGEALLLVPAQPRAAAAAIEALLADPAHMRHMSEAGRRRIGPPGGAERIARGIVSVARNRAAC